MTTNPEHDDITILYYELIIKTAYLRANRVWDMDPREVVSELYIALKEALPRFKGLNGAKQKHYAKVVMANKITDLRRKTGAKKRVTQLHFSDVGLGPLGDPVAWSE
jgi:hypothetical protein